MTTTMIMNVINTCGTWPAVADRDVIAMPNKRYLQLLYQT